MVETSHRSGAPWARWVSRPSSCLRPRLPSARHATRRAHTRQVHTTARHRHLRRSLPFRCRACWPSSAGQALCTEDSADSDGTQASHHNTQRSHRRISRTVEPVVPRTMSKLGSVDLASPPCTSLGLIAHQPDATHDTRRKRYSRHDVPPPLDIIIKPSKHGTELSSILASVFFLLSSRIFSFDTCFSCVICLASVSFLCQHPSYHRPDRVFSFYGLQASMGGIACRAFPHWTEQERQDTASRLRGGHTRLVFCLMSLCWNLVAISLLSSWHAKFITRYDSRFPIARLRLALSASRTC